MANYAAKESLIKFFDELAPKRDYWISKNAYYYRELENLHRRFVKNGKSVLDIGCGTGNLLASVSPAKGVGIDASFEMVKIAARKFPNFSFRVMDGHHIEINQKFDYIIMSNLVGYADDIWKILRELRKVCRPNSQIMITNYNYLWQPVMAVCEKLGLKMPDKIQNWLPQEFIKHFLYLCGFKVKKSGKFLHIPIYIPLLSRLLNNFLQKVPVINRFALVEYIVAKPYADWGGLKNKDTSVSVIVPTYEEAGNIKNIIERLPQIGNKMELIFVDLPGQDKTGQVIEEAIKTYQGTMQIMYVRQTQKNGKLGALRMGINKAIGKIIIIYDADMTVPPEDIEKVYLALLERKGDFVNGTRLVYPTEKGAMRFINHMGNTFFARLFSWSLGQHFTDTLCGTKGFWRKDFMDFEKTKVSYDNLDLFGDFYLILSAYKKKLKIAEVPVRYKTRRYGDTKMNRLKNGIRFLTMFLNFFWNYKISEIRKIRA